MTIMKYALSEQFGSRTSNEKDAGKLWEKYLLSILAPLQRRYWLLKHLNIDH